MSQYDFGNLSSPLSGTAFFDSNLEPWRNALHSLHSGSSRPSYVVAGMLWLDTTTNPWVLKLFDGSDDISMGTFNTSTNQYTPTNAGVADGAVTTAKLADNAVTNAKAADMAANTVKVRAAGSTGDASDLAIAASQLVGRGASGNVAPIVLGTNLSMSGTTLNAEGDNPVKAWVNFTSGGTINDSFGVTSITKNGTGNFTVNLSVTMANNGYAVAGATNDNAGFFLVTGQTTTTVIIHTKTSGGSFEDQSPMSVIVIGELA